MPIRPLLIILSCGLPLLGVIFAVLMGGYALAATTASPGEANVGADVLWYVAMATLVLLAGGSLALVMRRRRPA